MYLLLLPPPVKTRGPSRHHHVSRRPLNGDHILQRHDLLLSCLRPSLQRQQFRLHLYEDRLHHLQHNPLQSLYDRKQLHQIQQLLPSLNPLRMEPRVLLQGLLAEDYVRSVAVRRRRRHRPIVHLLHRHC